MKPSRVGREKQWTWRPGRRRGCKFQSFSLQILDSFIFLATGYCSSKTKASFIFEPMKLIIKTVIFRQFHVKLNTKKVRFLVKTLKFQPFKSSNFYKHDTSTGYIENFNWNLKWNLVENKFCGTLQNLVKHCHRNFDKFLWNFKSSYSLKLLNTSLGRFSPGTLLLSCWKSRKFVVFCVQHKKAQDKLVFEIVPRLLWVFYQQLEAKSYSITLKSWARFKNISRASLKSGGNLKKCMSQVRGTRFSTVSCAPVSSTTKRAKKLGKKHSCPPKSRIRTLLFST